MSQLAAEGTLIDERYRLGGRRTVDGEYEEYDAEQIRLSRPVCVRILNHTEGQDAIERFRRDAQQVSKLQHPGVAYVLDFGVHHGRPYVVYERPSARTLEQVLLSERTLPAERVRSILLQIAEALEHAHGLGVSHGSLQPRSILVGDDGRARLVGFRGVGGAHPDAGYLAPEARDDPRGDPRADLFSLGAIGYRALTGRLPFPPPASFERPAPPVAEVAEIPEEAEALALVVDRLIAVAPDRRYPSATWAANALRAAGSALSLPDLTADAELLRSSALLAETMSPPPLAPPEPVAAAPAAPAPPIAVPPSTAPLSASFPPVPPSRSPSGLPPWPSGAAAAAEAPPTAETAVVPAWPSDLPSEPPRRSVPPSALPSFPEIGTRRSSAPPPPAAAPIAQPALAVGSSAPATPPPPLAPVSSPATPPTAALDAEAAPLEVPPLAEPSIPISIQFPSEPIAISEVALPAAHQSAPSLGAQSKNSMELVAAEAGVKLRRGPPPKTDRWGTLILLVLLAVPYAWVSWSGGDPAAEARRRTLAGEAAEAIRRIEAAPSRDARLTAALAHAQLHAGDATAALGSYLEAAAEPASLSEADRQALVALLGMSPPDGDLAAAALVKLGKEALPLLRPLQKSEDVYLGCRAASALAELGDRVDLLGRCTKALADPSCARRRWAAARLSQDPRAAEDLAAAQRRAPECAPVPGE